MCRRKFLVVINLVDFGRSNLYFYSAESVDNSLETLKINRCVIVYLNLVKIFNRIDICLNIAARLCAVDFPN